MSFNLTVVLSQLWNRGHHVQPGKCSHASVLAVVCVYKSGHWRWGSALKDTKQCESVNNIIVNFNAKRQKRPYHLTTAPRELLTVRLQPNQDQKQHECFQLPNPCQYSQKVQSAE